MGKDTCGLLTDYPKAKKSRTTKCCHDDDDKSSNEELAPTWWAHLPSVVLHQIYKMLNHRDRINASSSCRNWRNNIYHSCFLRNLSIRADSANLSIFKNSHVSYLVQNALIKIDSFSLTYSSHLITILRHLSSNEHLRSLIIEPTRCQYNIPNEFLDEKLAVITELLLECCSKSLQHFSIGSCENLAPYADQFLERLAKFGADHVRTLGLATVKEDPLDFLIMNTDPFLLEPFGNLRVLSIDYDILTNDLIQALDGATKLTRLVCHVHGIDSHHPGTSDEAWINFKASHPDCQLRLSFIHAYEEIPVMHHHVLRKNMPLSHLRVYFGEQVNMDVVKILPTWYAKTLRSFVWVDSQNCSESAYSFLRLNLTEPDPLVMAAWSCTLLEEVVLLGYKYFEESLIAIARLRNNSLKILEVLRSDLSISNHALIGYINSNAEISTILGKPWAPLELKDVNPVFGNCLAGNSTEYILPKTLADLY